MLGAVLIESTAKLNYQSILLTSPRLVQIAVSVRERTIERG